MRIAGATYTSSTVDTDAENLLRKESSTTIISFLPWGFKWNEFKYRIVQYLEK